MPIRLVVWQLSVSLRPQARALITSYDERSILQSVIDSGDAERARALLERSGLAEYFLCPRFGAGDASVAVREIADELNVAHDAVLLIHDETSLASDPLMGHSFATADSRPRRLVYQEELARRRSERDFAGSSADFLATLDMTLNVARARRADLRRVMELAARTNQLGVTYTQDEIERLLVSPRYICWLVSLRDRFGDCGQVGLVVCETSGQVWTLLLFLFSCRVTARGIDTLVLNALLRRARAAGMRVHAHFRPTSRNESLWLAYLRAGFEPVASDGELRVLEHPLTNLPAHPAPVRLRGDWTDDA